MQTTPIEYYDDSQKLIGLLIQDEQCARSDQPAVLVFHALEGRNEFVIEYGKKIASQGYIVFVADMYGDGRVGTTLETCFSMIKPLLENRAWVRKRALLAYETLLQQKNIAQDKIGAVGFCFGGMCVLEIARSGASLKAGVSMHGVLTKSELATHTIKSHLLVLHGYEDPQSPENAFELFASEMKAARTEDWEFIYFSHAKHSFTDPATGTMDPAFEKQMGREYNQIAADRSYHYALDFFKELLLDKS